jgi:hypothetical protein
MNPIPTTYTLGQRTMNFVGALQSLPIHSKEHEQIAHKVLNKIHSPHLLHNKTPEELATLYRSMLAQAGVDADCVTAFADIAVELNLFCDVETLEDNVTPWVEPT